MSSAGRGVGRRAGRVAAVAVAGVVVLGGAALALFHDSVFQRVLEWSLRSATGLRLTVDGAVDLTHLAPLRFEARDVSVAVEGGGGRVGFVSGEIPLGTLVHRPVHFTRLVIRDAIIELLPDAGPTGARARFPAVESLELDNVRLAFPRAAERERVEVEIATLDARADDGGRLRATGEGSIDAVAWRVDGTFGTFAELVAPDVPYAVSVHVELPGSAIVLAIEGHWDDPLHGRGAQLDVRTTVGDAAWLVDRIAPGVPIAGAIEASGRLDGGFDVLALSGLDLRMADSTRFVASATGDVADLWQREGLALELTADTMDPRLLQAIGLDRLPGAGSVRARARLSGAPGAYRFEDTDIVVSGAEEREWRLGGSAVLGDRDGAPSIVELAVEVSAAVPAADLEHWFPAVSTMGRIELGASIASGADEQLSFEQLALALDGTHPFAGKITGRGVLAAGWREALAGVDPAAVARLLSRDATLELAVDVSGDVRETTTLLGMDVPTAGPFAASANVAWSAGRAALSDIDVRLVGPDPVAARARGALEIDGWNEAKRSFHGVALEVEASGPDASRLPAVPDFGAVGDGPWRISGKLAGKSGALSVRALHFESASVDGLRVDLDGEIDALGPLGPSVLGQAGGLAATVRVVAPSTRRAASLFGVDAPDLGKVEASFKAAREKEGWRLDSLVVQVADGERFELDARGSASRLPHDPRLALDLKLRAADAAVLEQKLGTPVGVPGPVSVDGKLDGGSQQLSFDGRLSVGATRLTGRAMLDGAGVRPKLVASFTTPLLDLGEFGWLPDPSAPGASSPGRAAPAGGRRLFSAEPLNLDWTGKADLDLTLDAKRLRGGPIEAGPLKVRGTSTDRLLNLSMDELTVESGEIVAKIVLDASRSPPELSVEARGKALSLGHLHAQIAPDANRLKGRYAFDLEFRAAGRSPHELAASADGHYGHVVTDGRLPGGDLDMLALRPLELVMTHANAKDHTRVDCSVIELRATGGVATSQSLFIRTGKVLVAGVGRIDLDAESVDIVVHTKPVDEGLLALFKGHHAARVHGPINDLKLDADVTSAVIGAALEGGLLGAAAMNPPVFAAVIGIEYLDRATKTKAAKPCHP